MLYGVLYDCPEVAVSTRVRAWNPSLDTLLELHTHLDSQPEGGTLKDVELESVAIFSPASFWAFRDWEIESIAAFHWSWLPVLKVNVSESVLMPLIFFDKYALNA
jgi:hypothetical protein